MFDEIDRVYDNGKARSELGWTPEFDFARILDQLSRGQPIGSDLARTVETLNGRIDGLNDELGTANNRLDAVAAMTGINIADVMDVPPLNKDVIAVNMDLAPGFVSINAGSGDGVRRGMVFQIYRGATYKGEVRVESVTEGACAAVVTTSVDGTQIMTGDSATTAL